MINFSMTQDQVTLYLDGRASTHYKGSTQYVALRQAILDDKLDESTARALVEPTGLLRKYLIGTDFTLSAADGSVFYKGQPVPKSISDRLNEMAKAGEDVGPMLRFFERLDKNPSNRSRDQLFTFMQHGNIAIEPSGTFLAYKGVRDDYKDCHSGTIDNTPGRVIKMQRNLISDDPDQTCHHGLHVGARGYAVGDSFSSGGFGSKHLVVRVDPENVVCVPNDYDAQKMRVCEYEVVGEFNESTDLTPTDAVEMADDDDDGTCEACYGTGTDDDEFEDCPECEGTGLALDDDADTDDAAPPVTTTKAAEKPVFVAANARGMDKLRSTLEFMEQPIAKLRKYAKKLKIVGATKIVGGKTALVAKIMEVRRTRGI